MTWGGGAQSSGPPGPLRGANLAENAPKATSHSARPSQVEGKNHQDKGPSEATEGPRRATRTAQAGQRQLNRRGHQNRWSQEDFSCLHGQAQESQTVSRGPTPHGKPQVAFALAVCVCDHYRAAYVLLSDASSSQEKDHPRGSSLAEALPQAFCQPFLLFLKTYVHLASAKKCGQQEASF